MDTQLLLRCEKTLQLQEHDQWLSQKPQEWDETLLTCTLADVTSMWQAIG